MIYWSKAYRCDAYDRDDDDDYDQPANMNYNYYHNDERVAAAQPLDYDFEYGDKKEMKHRLLLRNIYEFIQVYNQRHSNLFGDDHKTTRRPRKHDKVEKQQRKTS